MTREKWLFISKCHSIARNYYLWLAQNEARNCVAWITCYTMQRQLRPNCNPNTNFNDSDYTKLHKFTEDVKNWVDNGYIYHITK